MSTSKREPHPKTGFNNNVSIFRTQNQSLTDFTATKRKTKLRQKQVHEERPNLEQKPQKSGRVRMNMIQQNFALVREESKRSISKFYPHRPNKDRNQQQKSRQLKVIAYSLVKKGYGFNLFQEYASQNGQFHMLNREKYKSYTITIIQKCYRRVEFFLKSQCSRPIATMRHEEMRLLVRYLLRFNVYFQKVQAAAIVKFISHVYDLHAVTITQSQTLCLYRAVLSILKTILNGESVKAIERQVIKNETQQRQAFWSKKYDSKLIQLYKLNQNYPKIHKCLVTMHPAIQSHLSPQFIEARLQNIFRQALTKLSRYDLSEFRNLIELNANKMNFIIKSPTCCSIRLALLDFTQCKRSSIPSHISDIVGQINEKFDYSPNYDTKSPPKHHIIKQQPTAIKSNKHLRPQQQQSAKDWSRDVMQYGKIEEFDQSSRFMTPPNSYKQRTINPSNWDEQVSQEYSDS